MASQCPACLKINPADAHYCYYDGRPLSKERQHGPLHLGAMPFPIPFCFPDGQSCANFNQLALACDERWDEARGLLAQGLWVAFFRSIGRLDLAAVADRAAREPDRDVGLSQLLEKFPADNAALRPPRAAVETAQENLGPLTPGVDHKFELVIVNQGMLVLRGMASSDCDWLVFGDRVGPNSVKMFQTRNFCSITVSVLGKKLRAGLQPMQGEIVIDTNGGTLTVPVRANVPIRPFQRDVLAGATSPREIAQKAKQFPAEAAGLFEQGAVKAWYASNGWTYPIEGTEGSGKGAVQQFFEALGLTAPPRLQLGTPALTFHGNPGEFLVHHVRVLTDEMKPVYAQAWVNQDWMKVGPIVYLGNKVKVPILVTVPARPGETFEGQVLVRGNGRQEFVVPVSVTVEGGNAYAVSPQPLTFPESTPAAQMSGHAQAPPTWWDEWVAWLSHWWQQMR